MLLRYNRIMPQGGSKRCKSLVLAHDLAIHAPSIPCRLLCADQCLLPWCECCQTQQSDVGSSASRSLQSPWHACQSRPCSCSQSCLLWPLAAGSVPVQVILLSDLRCCLKKGHSYAPASSAHRPRERGGGGVAVHLVGLRTQKMQLGKNLAFR